MRKCSFAIALSVLLWSCGGNSARIKGNFTCVEDGIVYLETIDAGAPKVVDSAKMEKGKFAMKVKLPNGQQTIYNLRYHGQIIPLLLAPGDKAKLGAIGNISHSYTVEGSEGSALLREITFILNDGATGLDSIAGIYAQLNPDDTARRKIATDYANLYYQIKRDQVKFIVTNPTSIAAVYALYQRLPNDQTLFNGATDVVYYRMVTDSLEKYQPKSPYLPALKKFVESSMASATLQDMINDPANISKFNYPDIELPDMYGVKKKLSSLDGKVILLDFWTAASPECKMTNAELKDTYTKLAAKGFAVYQVSVDTSKPLWVTTVQDQKLPWVSVCDFRGQACVALGTYNVSKIPCNFLIDRQGNIVGKNLYGAKLEAKLNELL